MRKILWLITILILSTNTVLAAIYGDLRYGIGVYGTGEAAPIINLIEPMNNSGSIDGNITISYNVSDDNSIDNCSLIINNKINITHKSPAKNTKIGIRLNNTAVGIYNLSVNCTNSLNNAGESPKKAVSTIFMTHFNGTLANLSSIDIRNVTNFAVEMTSFGKINFSEGVDLSQGFDLNKYINISFNRIELNSSILSSLNKSATLQISGLTFSNPRILIDNIVCPSDICKKVSYSGGTLTFNVTHFTAYSSEETPAADSSSGSSSGGGSGGGGSGGGGGVEGVIQVPLKKEFALDKNIITAKILQGERKTIDLQIKNTGNVKLGFNIEIKNIEFATVSENHFELNSEETKTITILLNVPENIEPDTYSGNILIRSGDIEKDIIVIIEVKDRKALFDIELDIYPDYKKILSGREVKFKLNLLKLGTITPVDVELYYAIKDIDGNVINFQTETLAVAENLSLDRSLKNHKELKSGNYIVYSRVLYENQAASASDIFEVIGASKIEEYEAKKRIYILLLLLMLAIMFIVAVSNSYAIRKIFKKYKSIRRYLSVKEKLTAKKEREINKEFEIMDKGLIEAVLKKGAKYIDDDIHKNIKMLINNGYNKRKIRNILINAGFDLIDIDDALEYYFRRKKEK